MKFSERHGYTESDTSPQVERLDKETRTRIWNLLAKVLISYSNGEEGVEYDTSFYSEARKLWDKYYYEDVDKFPSDPRDFADKIKGTIFSADWYRILDFVEVTSDYDYGFMRDRYLSEKYNEIFREENVAYRVIDGRVTPIAETEEKEAIEEALQKTSAYEGVNEHIKKANKYLSDRSDPDYRNSIKESISAVESMVRIIVGDEGATLGQALNRLREEKGLHPALKQGFSKLYGYTSDADGIRHGLLEKSDLTFTEAKFMYVICASFVTYLIDQFEAS
jgi:hypothetical protein